MKVSLFNVKTRRNRLTYYLLIYYHGVCLLKQVDENLEKIENEDIVDST